jgi:alpha-beta hydrolase superfamily lysophospholipase
MIHNEGRFSGYGGLELYYQCWRPEAKPKAVLTITHGHGEHSGRYGNVVDWFVPRGYAVHAFDLRGHGHSAGPRGHIDRWDVLREDLGAFLALVREQERGQPVFLMGHSLGGLIALEYVLHHPEGLAGVVASGPVLSEPGISPFLITLSKVLSRIVPRLALKSGLDTTALSRDPAVVAAYVNDPLVHSFGTARLGAELAKAVEWTQAHAADLALPCLIVHGAEDRICPPEGSRIFYENVAFADKERQVYAGYYHEVYNDVGKEQVLAAVQAWIERHLPAGSG